MWKIKNPFYRISVPFNSRVHKNQKNYPISHESPIVSQIRIDHRYEYCETQLSRFYSRRRPFADDFTIRIQLVYGTLLYASNAWFGSTSSFHLLIVGHPKNRNSLFHGRIPGPLQWSSPRPRFRNGRERVSRNNVLAYSRNIPRADQSRSSVPHESKTFREGTFRRARSHRRSACFHLIPHWCMPSFIRMFQQFHNIPKSYRRMMYEPVLGGYWKRGYPRVWVFDQSAATIWDGVRVWH